MKQRKLLLADISALDMVSDIIDTYDILCPYQFLYEMRVLNTISVFDILKHGKLAIPDIDSKIDFKHYRPTPLLYSELSGHRHLMLVNSDTSFKIIYNIEKDYAITCLKNIENKPISQYNYSETGLTTNHIYKNLLKSLLQDIILDEQLRMTLIDDCYNNKFQCAPPLINKSVKNVMLYALYITTRMLHRESLSDVLKRYVFNDFIYATQHLSELDGIDVHTATMKKHILGEFNQIFGRFAFDMKPSLLTFYIIYMMNLENCVRQFGDIEGMENVGEVCKDIRNLYYLPLCDVFMTENPNQIKIVENLPNIFTQYKDNIYE